MSKNWTSDVVIVGGGIVGISTAIALQHRGKRVMLVDPGNRNAAASYGNAGMINRASLFPVAGPHIWRSLARYATNRDPSLHLDHKTLWRVRPWLRHFLQRSNRTAWRQAAHALDPLVDAALSAHQNLAKLAGAEDLLDRCGWLRLYRSDEAFRKTALERDILADRGVQFDILKGAEIAEMEPALTRRFAHAVLYPEMTQIRNPGALVEAYERYFRASGGEIVVAAATDLTPEPGGWRVRWADGEASAPQAVLAAGAWSDRFARRLGYRLPVAVERGYHRQFAQGSGLALNRPVHDTGGACVIVPMQQGIRVLCGIELAPRGAKPNHRLIDAAVSAATGTVSLGAPIDAQPWLGSRPSTPDGLPVIGLAPRHGGLAFAFGHGHIGMSTGPITGRIVADLLTARQLPFSIAAFAPDRF